MDILFSYHSIWKLWCFSFESVITNYHGIANILDLKSHSRHRRKVFPESIDCREFGRFNFKVLITFQQKPGLKRVKGKTVLYICGRSLFSLTTHIYFCACCSSLIPDVIFHSLPTWTESQKISRELPWLQHGIKTVGTSDFIDWTTTEFSVFHPNVHYWSTQLAIIQDNICIVYKYYIKI